MSNDGWDAIADVQTHDHAEFLEFDNELLDEMANELDLYDYFTEEENIECMNSGSGMWKAHCPFSDHLDEQSASFTIYEDTNSFYCFGCNRGGNIYTWLTNKYGKNMNFVEAVKLVSLITNINPNLDPNTAIERMSKKFSDETQKDSDTYFNKTEFNFIISKLGFQHIKISNYDREEIEFIEKVYELLDKIILNYDKYDKDIKQIESKLMEKLKTRRSLLYNRKAKTIKSINKATP